MYEKMPPLDFLSMDAAKWLIIKKFKFSWIDFSFSTDVQEWSYFTLQ